MNNPPRVLVVEDDRINQKLLSKHLQLLGYDFELADDGQQGLERWGSGGHQLVLTDQTMPHLDGCGLLRAITRLARERGQTCPPMLLMSANTDAALRLRAQAAGAAGFIAKPVELGTLRPLLLQHVGVPPVQAAQPPDAQLFDPTALREAFGDDAAAVHEVLEAFVHDLPRLAEELAQALRAADTPQAGALAHKLQSASRSVGATALADFCATLQANRTRGGCAAESALMLQTLEELCQRTRERVCAAFEQGAA
jgi:CheY-like chemotaxis protein